MFRKVELLTRVAPAMIGVAIAGAAYAASDGDGAAQRCEIRTAQSGSMISLDGVLLADGAGAGSYSFQVVSVGGSGNTNIRQGGGFSAGAGEELTLGRVTVGGYGAVYEASLEVTFDGETFECSERVGGNI